MGHHIDENGRFQSDKHKLPPDKVVISLHDSCAREGLMVVARNHIERGDREFGEDLHHRLTQLISGKAGQCDA